MINPRTLPQRTLSQRTLEAQRDRALVLCDVDTAERIQTQIEITIVLNALKHISIVALILIALAIGIRALTGAQ